MREFVSGYSSGYAYDDGENDVITLYISGPRGGTRCSEILSTVQARMLRDSLDLALTKINDAHVRAEEAGQGSIRHMPERNSDDAVDENGCPTW